MKQNTLTIHSENILGHFGLGFYSAYMVASKAEIDTLRWEHFYVY